MRFCPCGFEGGGYRMFSYEWSVAHEAHHLGVFPGVDERTREILRESCKESLDAPDKV